jgi:heptaprenylglyceryl phosphate synthase
MKPNLGILGDPAKLDLYENQFFSILEHDERQVAFHLIGASEDDVTRQQYKKMYHSLIDHIGNLQFNPLPRLNGSQRRDASGRIGLFPSSASHLIRGPSFIFAPFPINSTSTYLKFKSKFLNFILSPVLSHKVLNLAYFPLGGKAASKTLANSEQTEDEIGLIFHDIRLDHWFDYYYLEAGSGQEFLSDEFIQKILAQQASALLDKPLSEFKEDFDHLNPLRYIVPGSIYGGGIRTVAQIDKILAPTDSPTLIPEIIVIGNVSEENISETYNILERMQELDTLDTLDVNHIFQ